MAIDRVKALDATNAYVTAEEEYARAEADVEAARKRLIEAGEERTRAHNALMEALEIEEDR